MHALPSVTITWPVGDNLDEPGKTGMWRLPRGDVHLAAFPITGGIMRTKLASSCAFCLTLLLAAQAVLAAAKHFQASSDHFHDYSAKAAELYFKAEQPEEKHVLNNLSSVSAIYAEKAALIANLAALEERLSAKRDRVLTMDRIHDVKRQYALSLPQDIKLLSDLVEAQRDPAIRSLGNLVVNELRVFERNVDNL